MKRVKEFKVDQEIPSNATFLYCKESLMRGGPGRSSVTFFYEVPDKVERSKSTKTIVNFMPEIREIVEYLNERAGKSYRYQTDKTKKLIFKWLSDGWKVEEFKVAIDNMCDAWLTDPKMSQYLRPETLFGTKFEGYYNKGNQPNENDIFSELDDIVGGISNE